MTKSARALNDETHISNFLFTTTRVSLRGATFAISANFALGAAFVTAGVRTTFAFNATVTRSTATFATDVAVTDGTTFTFKASFILGAAVVAAGIGADRNAPVAFANLTMGATFA